MKKLLLVMALVSLLPFTAWASSDWGSMIWGQDNWYFTDDCPNDPENDIDNDGTCGDVDNCPTIPNGQNLGTCYTRIIGTTCISEDECGCGICNMAQEDTDEDKVGDVCDNCPFNCNYDQRDADGDGIGDVCDGDPGCGGCAGPQCEQEC